MTNKQRVSTVIPNYNGKHLLKKNLPAVLKTLRDRDELVIIDDASSDGSIAWLAEKFETRNQKLKTNGRLIKVKIGKYTTKDNSIRVVIVPNFKNLRFAKSVNKAVSMAKHDLIFLLNNDVSPSADCLDHLVHHFQDQNVFAVGCKEIEQNLNGQISGKNELKFIRGMFIHNRAKEFEFGPTAWASGGSAMFDKSKWLALGGFDSLFAPAYWEDIDLSFRARKKKWKVLFEPKAVVDHNHESTNRDAFGQKKIERMSWENAKKFVKKNGNWWQKILYKLWRPYWWWKVERNTL